MKIPPYLLPALLLIGCASHQSVTDLDPGPLPKNGGRAESSAASIRLPEQEKAYPVGRYQDPDDPSVMHEGHTVYRVETSSAWNLAPNEPTALPLGPTVAVADPDHEHITLTAELEEKLQQEDLLLQTTYAQNERLTEEIKKLQELQPRLRVPDPPVVPPQMAPSQPAPPTNAPPAAPNPPMNPSPAQNPFTSWWQWLWS